MGSDRSERPGPPGSADVFDAIDAARPAWGDWDNPFGPDDPERRRRALRGRLGRLGAGFSTLGLALVVAALSAVGTLFLILARRPVNVGAALGVDRWDFLVDTAIVWGSTLGVTLLWGRWPDPRWTRRSGLLLMMCLADVVLWSAEHARILGLSEVELGHEWFRHALGQALGWSEFALIAGLSAEMAARFGQDQAADFGRTARALATTGAMVWLYYFSMRTRWAAPAWPLRPRPLNGLTILLALGVHLIVSINLVQLSILSLLAGRACAAEARRMDVEDRRADDFPPPA